MTQNFKLTALSHGGGCGCKISPSMLRKLLENIPALSDSQLLLGSDTFDDAALYKLNSEQVLIATTDFFVPLVDNPFDFGRIAAANALSDIYAMGGKPILALNILGMPTDKVATEVIAQILEGGSASCNCAGVAVAGGHSIDCAEPFYGLSVCGLAHPDHIKQNDTAQSGDVLLLGKPLGIGVLAAAYKQNKLDQAGYETLIKYASQLNDIGADLAQLKSVHAMTDVTGFGLLCHLLEMCRASKLQAVINANDIPLIEQAVDLAAGGVSTGAGTRNWEYCCRNVELSARAKEIKTLLSDPQTNGGLLVACSPTAASEVQNLLLEKGFEQATIIGNLNNLEAGKIGVI